MTMRRDAIIILVNETTSNWQADKFLTNNLESLFKMIFKNN